MVLLNSVRTSGKRQAALARLDAASYRCKRFRSRWQLQPHGFWISAMQTTLLVSHVLCFPSFSTDAACCPVFVSFLLLCTLPLSLISESHLISRLSLNVTRLVSSRGA